MTFQTRTIVRMVVILAAILLALFLASRSYPQITGEIGEEIDIGLKAPDMSFFSADTINLKVNSSDDVFAAGSTVNVDTTSADHLVIAGGEVTVRNVAIEDLFAAGGELDLVSGTVADDIVVAGGEITVRKTFEIGGSAVIAGGEALIEAPVPVDLRAGAGTVYLNSRVGGDARLSGDKVTLGPEAVVGGDLLYRTENLVIESGAVVSGQRRAMPAEDHSAFESWGRGAGELFGKLLLAATLGFAVLVLTVAVAVPSLMRSSAGFIKSRPLQSVGIGTLIAIGTPVAIVLLFASVIGAPLAMLLIAICLAITPVAVAATAFFVGMESRKIATKAEAPPTGWGGRLLWPALGALVILLLGMIPFVGILVWLFALLFGLGAVASRGGRALAVSA
ncbi:bactofilin family protein [Pontixanthobacter gangjinensis]|uniref:DUF8173 domain-containing protein n=1 Tax=Pontixanthobacter gangjinensis TaxID=1028742 RepID=A0A6I4SN12_9SPHN|nr:polymer-forming cytoskeletal protein [Pontixanthobacter gangjinensis]MXO57281.1 hypothetical protein [Pontixanthobacter gangjinensis]